MRNSPDISRSIPFQWKRLKLASGKAVSASCSSNLATTSAGGTFVRGGWRRGVYVGRQHDVILFFFFPLME